MKQREIKFRAWDEKNKEMRYDGMLNIYNKDGSWLYEDGKGNFHSSFGEIMQFTGLLDKNGKEIYEGDIVQYLFAGKKVVREVYWNEVNFCWTPLNQNSLDMEIIGNIYENPDLLK